MRVRTAFGPLVFAATAVAVSLWQPGLWSPDRGMTVVLAMDRLGELRSPVIARPGSTGR